MQAIASSFGRAKRAARAGCVAACDRHQPFASAPEAPDEIRGVLVIGAPDWLGTLGMERHAIVEVAVVGGGPAGLTAAIALAAAGVETALISKPPPAGQSHHGAARPARSRRSKRWRSGRCAARKPRR